MKTKAAILFETDKPLIIDEVEIPEIRRGQIQVQIRSTGVCHSQLDEIKALKGPDKFLPHTMGHEAAGYVEKVGPGVTKVKEGDYVAVSWIKGSGLESDPIGYKLGETKINAGKAATFIEHALVSENRITRVQKIPNNLAALLGCAVPSGGGIVLHELGEDTEGKSLAVFGIGGVGSSAVLAAQYLTNLSKIIAVDVYDHKLNHARRLGATHTINAVIEDPIKAINNIVPGGVDYAIECAGSLKAMQAAFYSTREGVEGNGGLTVIAGNVSKTEFFSVPTFELKKGRKLIGTWAGKTDTDQDLPFYVKAFLDGDFPLERLLTHTYKFTQINEALEALDQGKVGRAVIEM